MGHSSAGLAGLALCGRLGRVTPCLLLAALGAVAGGSIIPPHDSPGHLHGPNVTERYASLHPLYTRRPCYSQTSTPRPSLLTLLSVSKTAGHFSRAANRFGPRGRERVTSNKNDLPLLQVHGGGPLDRPATAAVTRCARVRCADARCGRQQPGWRFNRRPLPRVGTQRRAGGRARRGGAHSALNGGIGGGPLADGRGLLRRGIRSSRGNGRPRLLPCGRRRPRFGGCFRGGPPLGSPRCCPRCGLRRCRGGGRPSRRFGR